jgi:pimeloyl-ACP methyl ester carboxylesterase
VIEFEGMHEGYEPALLLPRIECPVLFLLADADLGSAVSPASESRAVELLPDAQVIRMPGTTHGLVWEEPEAVLRAIESFVDSL